MMFREKNSQFSVWDTTTHERTFELPENFEIVENMI